MSDLLPDSRLTTVWTPKGTKMVAGVAHQPIYCANCGTDGGLVPEGATNHAFYLCKPCAETYGQIAGTMMVPDEVFWARWNEAQLETYGRLLTEAEVVVQSQDPDSLVTKFTTPPK